MRRFEDGKSGLVAVARVHEIRTSRLPTLKQNGPK
jgi:hypothetical protein